jgi:hypothetical protein
MSRRKFVSIALLARLVAVSVGCTFSDGPDEIGNFKAVPGTEDCAAAEGGCQVHEAEDCTEVDGCSGAE